MGSSQAPALSGTSGQALGKLGCGYMGFAPKYQAFNKLVTWKDNVMLRFQTRLQEVFKTELFLGTRTMLLVIVSSLNPKVMLRKGITAV